MDVSDNREIDLFFNGGNGFGILFIKDSQTGNFTASFFQCSDLGNSLFNILCRYISHGLQDTSVLSTDLYLSDMNGSCFCTFHGKFLQFQLCHKKIWKRCMILI